MSQEEVLKELESECREAGGEFKGPEDSSMTDGYYDGMTVWEGLCRLSGQNVGIRRFDDDQATVTHSDWSDNKFGSFTTDTEDLTFYAAEMTREDDGNTTRHGDQTDNKVMTFRATDTPDANWDEEGNGIWVDAE